METTTTDPGRKTIKMKPERPNIEFTNLAAGAILNVLEVTTAGQPLEVR